VRLSHAAFLDGLDLTGATFLRRATFDAAWFGRHSSFARTKFAGTSFLSFARFEDKAIFRGAEFGAFSSFNSSRFCALADFGETRFNGNTEFPSIRTAGDAVFNGAAFPRGANFVGAEVAGQLDLTSIQTDGLLAFASSSIGNLRIGLDAGSGSTIFGAQLDFSGSAIESTTIQNVVFARSLDFSSAMLGASVVSRNIFRDANVRGDRRMADSPARFGCENLQDDQSATEQATQLEAATFRDSVSFRRAVFRGQTSFSEVDFNKNADLTEATFQPRIGESSPHVRFSRMHAETINIEWKNMPPLSAFTRNAGDPPVSSMLEELISGYESRKRSNDVLLATEARGWMQWHEALACLAHPAMTDKANKSEPKCSLLGSVFQSFALFIWGISSGFGTSLIKLSALILILDCAFAFIYMYFGKIVVTAGTNSDSDSEVRLRLLELPGAFRSGSNASSQFTLRWAEFREAIALSTAILLRFGRKNMRISGGVGRVKIDTIVAIEWVLGALLLLDFGYTLHSQPFVQEIIHGILG
jgi:hypothetical protein